jgi:hypothetical protein
MVPAAHIRFLHVANGTATTMTMPAAGIRGLYSIWADPLYEGPVPGGLSDEDLLEVRASFLGPPPEDGTDLRQWRQAIEGHDGYDELILWYEHDLFDQLNLIQLLAWIRDRLPPTKPVSLICIDSFPGRPDFKGLGELSPAELASLLDTRRPVSGAQYELARRGWQAFREPTPAALDALRHENTSALPYLAAAVTRFLQEYPWSIDGLSRAERRLLQLAEGNGIALWKGFPRMQDGERAYYVTDGSLADMAETLSLTSPPLLTLDLPATSQRHILDASVALTDAGRAVLSGQLDRVTMCGIDRWLGGVHLQGHGPLWRWDDRAQRVVHA